MRPDIKESLDRYEKDHCPTGSFLRSVLENNLTEAFGKADDDNLRDMFEIVGYCYNHVRYTCWGSPEKVRAWLGEKPLTIVCPECGHMFPK